jgi:hypothetical protein
VKRATATTTTASTTPPTTTTTEPPTTTTVPPIAYPPTTLKQAKALAATGDSNVFDEWKIRSNQSASCPNTGFYVTAPTSLTDQQLSADLLAYYFLLLQNNVNVTDCGGMSITAYDAPSFNANLVATVTLLISPQYELTVELASDNTSFDFTYRK